MSDGAGSFAAMDPVALIASDSDQLIRAAAAAPDAPVEHAPGWTNTDLLRHIAQVHWGWATVVETPIGSEEQFRAHPDFEAGPDPVADAREQAARLVRVLGSADPAAPCFFWSADPQFHNVAAIRRHQVQEAAVHRWDAQNAAGSAEPIDREAAVDAIDEFLTVSVITAAAPSEWISGQALGRPLVLRATDADRSWTVADDGPAGVVRMQPGELEDAAVVSGTASDLLLWLYQRVELPTDDPDLVTRFRTVANTD